MRIALAKVASIVSLAAIVFVAVSSAPYSSAADSNPATPSQQADPPSGFTAQVMAVLSKAGCNQGGCHGNQNGKGGFKLSLRGQSPTDDYAALVREAFGRRVNPLDPDASLLLLKAANLVPHQGGRRFERESVEYQALRRWIAAGALHDSPDAPRLERLEVEPRDAVVAAPDEKLPLRATATFSDGTRRDVTRWAAYETTSLHAEVTRDGVVERRQNGETTVVVRYLDQQVPATIAFVARRATPGVALSTPASNRIDELIGAKLSKLSIEPSASADDATWLRRLYLDLAGVLPKGDEAREFVADESPDKRQRAIDRIVARPEFAEYWALRWCDILRVEEKVLDPRGVDGFHAWLRDSLALGKPLDELIREILTARGSTYNNPPANYWRALREPAARGESTARLFLGVRLQCAQCHNHPFDRWTQDDYYQWMSLFARVDYRVLSNERRDKLDLNEFNGEQVVEWKDEGSVKNPRTGQPAPARFLGAASPLPADAAPLESLAAWLANRDNRQFARAQTNFVWYHVMGRGLVEPIDDLRATNPPSNPALLEWLADELARREFDLRGLVRELVSSTTYGRSAQPNESNREDEQNFARAVVKRYSAEVILDAQTAVLDVPPRFAGYPVGTRAVQLAGVQRGRDRDGNSGGDRWLKMFGKPSRLLGCECERSVDTTLGQALTLLGDADLNARLTAAENLPAQLSSRSLDPGEQVDGLYWAALGRAPTGDERVAAIQFVESNSARVDALRDLAWVLLNAKEFLFRH